MVKFSLLKSTFQIELEHTEVTLLKFFLAYVYQSYTLAPTIILL